MESGQLIKEYEHYCLLRANAAAKQEELKTDLIGIQKSGHDKLRRLEAVKQEHHRKVDIVHMLTHDINEHNAKNL